MTESENGSVHPGTGPPTGVSNLEEATPGPEARTDAAQGTPLPPEAPRRSGRRITRTTPFDPAAKSAAVIESSAKGSAPSGANETRRNPKRKATEPARQLSLASSDLLEEALRPLEPAETEEWEGWIALESEPAFFNIILRELGIHNVKAQELFTLDQTSIDYLSKPIFGLIFLFEYHPGLDEEGEDEEIGDLWFANQVTHNACATVALLNITMNVPDLHLGPQLRQFREDTQDLNTALRGHRLSTNKFIRAIHNSFTRRIHQLNADLALENEASKPKPKKSKTVANGRNATKSKSRGRGKVESSTYGYHFIAYVPSGGHVWELDGLKSTPQKLGAIDSDDWTAIARPQIEARILQYEETQLSFNLLALCQSPLAGYKENIGRGVVSLRALHRKMDGQTAFKELILSEDVPPYLEEDTCLAEFHLDNMDNENFEIPQTLQETFENPDLSVEAAHSLHRQLVVDTKAAMGEYRAELLAMADDERRVQGRKRDFGPALHKWVTKLAEKGVLEDIIKAS